MSSLYCLRFAFVGQHFSCACHPPTLLVVQVHNDIRGGGILWSLIITACDETGEPVWPDINSAKHLPAASCFASLQLNCLWPQLSINLPLPNVEHDEHDDDDGESSRHCARSV